jgi:hypothetical protein
MMQLEHHRKSPKGKYWWVPNKPSIMISNNSILMIINPHKQWRMIPATRLLPFWLSQGYHSHIFPASRIVFSIYVYTQIDVFLFFFACEK